MSRPSIPAIALAGVIALGACSGMASAPRSGDDAFVVLSVHPASGATNVSPSSPISIAFSHRLMMGMELLVTLHEGTILGPAVPGSFSWSSDGKILTFVPTQTLESQTTYVLHLSPNLRAATGQGIALAACAQKVGGQPAAPGMMNGMMGGPGGGMMGPGWEAGQGTWGYGMTFTFTTA